MKKKLLLIPLLATLFLLTACSQKPLPSDFNVDEAKGLAVLYTQFTLGLNEEELALLANDPEFLLGEEIITDEEQETIFKALGAGTITSKSEAGAPAQDISALQVTDYTLSGVNSDVVTLIVPITFDQHVVNYEFTFEHNPDAQFNPHVSNYELTQAVVATQYTLGELLKQAGMNTLMGIGIVFCVLIFISFIISLFKYVPGSGAYEEKKKAEQKKAEVVAPVATPSQPVAPVANENLVNDQELVAVITAAIYAAQGSQPTRVSSDKLVVRSIKRVSR